MRVKHHLMLDKPRETTRSGCRSPETNGRRNGPRYARAIVFHGWGVANSADDASFRTKGKYPVVGILIGCPHEREVEQANSKYRVVGIS